MSEVNPDISLAEMSPADAQCVWQSGHLEGDWPLLETRQENFLRLVEEYQSLSILHLGDMLSIRHRTQLHGFALCNTIAETWLPAHVTAVECGTYLLPESRGKGFNLPVKAALLTHAFQFYQANWCLFIVAQENHRAQAAMKKLPWPFELESGATPGVFQRYLRRKTWELGHDCLLYKLPQSAFHRLKTGKPSRSLNPDGD